MIHPRQNSQTIEYTDLAKQRQEAGLCVNCNKPKSEWPKGRHRNYRCCCKECTRKMWLNTDLVIVKNWNLLRDKVFKRDDYTCVMCGHKPMTTVKTHIWDDNPGPPKEIPDLSQLIGDHIRPIALGGPQWDPDNIQTLCKACNKIKTARDMRPIARARKAEVVLHGTQTRLKDFN